MWIWYFFRGNSLFISLSTSVDGQKFPGFCYYTFFKTINRVDYHLYTYKHTEGYNCRGEFARSKHMSVYNLNPVFLLRGIMPIQSLLLGTLQDRFKKEASNLCWISTLAAARTPPWDLSLLFSRGVQPTGWYGGQCLWVPESAPSLPHSVTGHLTASSCPNFPTYRIGGIMAQMVKNLPAMQKSQVWFLG